MTLLANERKSAKHPELGRANIILHPLNRLARPLYSSGDPLRSPCLGRSPHSISLPVSFANKVFDAQGALVEGLGLLILALVEVEPGQFMQCIRSGGMLGSKNLLTDAQGALVEWLGLLILALVEVEHCKNMQRDTSVGMLGSV